MVMRPATTADAREISERLGTYTFRARSRSMGTWGRGGGSVSDSDQRRPLLLPQELMQLPEKDMIVLRLGIPPVYGRKIRFYEEKDMVALTKISPPTMPTIRPDPAAATNSLRVIAAAEAEENAGNGPGSSSDPTSTTFRHRLNRAAIDAALALPRAARRNLVWLHGPSASALRSMTFLSACQLTALGCRRRWNTGSVRERGAARQL
jgi:type IV secretion system protein VirD4